MLQTECSKGAKEKWKQRQSRLGKGRERSLFGNVRGVCNVLGSLVSRFYDSRARFQPNSNELFWEMRFLHLLVHCKQLIRPLSVRLRPKSQIFGVSRQSSRLWCGTIHTTVYCNNWLKRPRNSLRCNPRRMFGASKKIFNPTAFWYRKVCSNEANQTGQDLIVCPP